MSNNNLPNIAIIGSASWSEALIVGFQTAGFTVKAIVGRTLSNVQKVASKYSIEVATVDSRLKEDILSRPDIQLVAISLRPTKDVSVILDIIAAGKHVLVEKNHVFGMEGTLKLSEAQSKVKTLAAYNLQYRSFKPVQAAKKFIEEGSLGETQFATIDMHSFGVQQPYGWFHLREEGGGVIRALFPHFVDALSYATDSEIQSISAQGFQARSPPKDDQGNDMPVTSEDLSMATAILKNNPKSKNFPVSIRISLASSDNSNIVVYGTKGTLRIDLGYGGLFFRPNGQSLASEEVLLANSATPLPLFFSGFMDHAVTLANHFRSSPADANHEVNDAIVSFSQGVRMAKMQEAAWISIDRQGQQVDINKI